MLKIILYSATERKFASSCPINEACLRDINYMRLLNGEPVPSYRAICHFRSEVLSECGKKIFYELICNLKGLGEIAFEHLFVDGTKIEANANKILCFIFLEPIPNRSFIVL
jgi:Transposase and inactivated derivatives